ncbi:serine/threonine protein kinase [Streptomyces armeniacus]|uniref:Serine/threonine protein kinase n=1 Tax=Streptomyces armeniacus TaxID=83291 RepID=A0A345XV99_9ACTN|nr:serine/threonine-protein kinase [Streptomyces armeniacus]AXK35565.1 serine/threonine protein kinase [Streptomyces armeniacus]
MERLDRGDPRTVGRYRILARVGTGGMATVYLGRSRGGRAAAVKVMHAEFAREPEFRERFRYEVGVTTAAGGAYSPPVLGADPDAAVPWMATEFLPSVSLREAVERYGPLPGDAVLRLAAGLAEALAALHRAGVVHLDVTPANVLLTADGPRLVDFGIAAGARTSGHAGSWGYMSPEQVAGDAGPPSDVYSLGATLDHARGGEDNERAAALRTLIADCRRPDPADRPTAAELTRRLAGAEAEAEGGAEGGAEVEAEAGGTAGGAAESTAGDPVRDVARWLPPAVTAAIDARASAADNPPAPPPPRPGRRRLLAAGAAAVVTAAGGTAAVLALTRGDDTRSGPGNALRETPGAVPAASNSPSYPSDPSPSPSADPVRLEFVITGDAPLTTLAYAVNGRFTRLENVPLPWRKTVEVPHQTPAADWRLRLTLPSGRIRYRVLVDGTETRNESHPVNTAFGYPYDVDTGGLVAATDIMTSGPLAGPGG